MMLPGDYCRCVGKECEHKDGCLRFLAWLEKDSPRFISVAERLCSWTEDGECSKNHYIPAGDVKK